MTMTVDAVIVADSRFAGGSTSALVADVSAMAALGMKIGLYFVRSGYLDDSRDRVNPKAAALADLDGVTLLSAADPAKAQLAFLHHPMVFSHGIEERLNLKADRAVIVTHHPPFRSDGSLEWNPMATLLRARSATGLTPWFAPVSGVVRVQLASFAPLVRQTSYDWPNTFDPEDWPNTHPILCGPGLTIGRHGRPDPLKFPATGAEIDAALPASETVRVRVMGCPSDVLGTKGAHVDRWDILPFGAEPVPDFLNSLDVFTYHYHPVWQEAFGRTIVEAILCGRPCLLDPRLKPTFDGLAEFCSPAETADALARLAQDQDKTRDRARAARDAAMRLYSTAEMEARLDALRADPGDTSRSEFAKAPHEVLRKLAGLYRRRATGAG